jgi:DNA repair protein RecO (recombination protein O)
MPTTNVEAIILSRKDYYEADRMVVAYTKSLGKIKILAKGSRRLKSKMASHIEPFCVGKYFLAEGKTSYILAGAESIHTNSGLTENIEIYKDASYVCELLQMVSVENQASEAIFNETKKILSLMSKVDGKKRKILLRYFEYFLLSRIGYEPDYIQCKICQGTITQQPSYTGDFEGVTCEKCSAGSQNIRLSTLKVLRLFTKEDLSTIINITDIDKECSSIKEITYPYLCDILPKTPNSENL